MTWSDDDYIREPAVPTVEDILLCCRHNVRSNIHYEDFGRIRTNEHIDTIETLLLSLLETLADDQKIALQNKIIMKGA